jgi:heptosyltransferase-2
MADAAGVPGVALFGSTVRELGFFPIGGTLRVLERPLDCRPCSHVGRRACPLGHLDCLRSLEADLVLRTCLAAEAAC